MAMPNSRFRVLVNHVTLIVATLALANTAQAAKRKRNVPVAPAPVIVDHFQTEMLRTHNAERRFQGRAPLLWDAALAADAAKWAGTLAAKNRFEHAFAELTKKKQGENLWMGTRGSYRFDEMVAFWIDEVEANPIWPFSRCFQDRKLGRCGSFYPVGVAFDDKSWLCDQIICA